MMHWLSINLFFNVLDGRNVCGYLKMKNCILAFKRNCEQISEGF